MQRKVGAKELGQEGVACGVTVWNTLKGGGTEKRGEETKTFKRGDKLGQGVGGFKKGDWNSLRNYDPIKIFMSNSWLSSFWRNSQYAQG